MFIEKDNIIKEVIEIGDKVRLAGIAYESLVNGPGMRRVLFAQGCRHNCKGCFNKDTHDFNAGKLLAMDEIIEDVAQNPLLKGITFSGGDPFEQAKEFTYMAKEFKKLGLNVWSYSGYKFEQILDDKEKFDLLKNIDVLVDGKFEEGKANDSLRFRGSSNQRIIDVKKSLDFKKIIELEY